MKLQFSVVWDNYLTQEVVDEMVNGTSFGTRAMFMWECELTEPTVSTHNFWAPPPPVFVRHLGSSQGRSQ